ncbi:vacuolar membrane-associated protein iml1 [Diatrype stigma]|uniref:Vacuolar membrane-associated protein IML1 n=1 Tax=Diatrype stigma TaxID=117547 RepID=A0AAN9UPJ1_9PEZI
MPRNAASSPSIPRRASQWTSQLRSFSRPGLDKDSSSKSYLDVPREPQSPDTMSSNSTVRDSHSSRRVAERTCTVTINESIIRDEILLNLDLLGGGIKPGMLMSITATDSDQDRMQGSYYGSLRSSSYRRGFASTAAEGLSKPRRDANRRYIFVVKDMAKELKTRHPTVEVYIAKHIADAFNMRNRSQVVLAPVDHAAPAVRASHVELTFKDMYLSRSDMWRIAVDDLADRTVYKGQVVYSLGTIKATVSTVFVEGRKVHSAFFGRDTRPIFRSESARYVLFIQMAREMWDFDSDGSGEIMFYKVVNGFLPALFKKWAMMQVKHLVTIVLFARMEYDTGLTTELANASLHDDYYTGYQTSGSKRPYKDFYRVVISEMSSGEWTTILHQLKKEFNTFRRDISLHHQYAMNYNGETPEESSVKGTTASRIKAESSLAMYGNFLEAINLASSQYAHDYIDRDLLRTGISIVVISPGSGVFEVEYETLRRSTEALVSNGIGIDLICIPNLPLHSVPLFRYRNPHYVAPNQRLQLRSIRSRDSTPKQPGSLAGSYNSLAESLTPTKTTDNSFRTESLTCHIHAEEWSFALPQWLHVSYWTGKSEDALSFQGITLNALTSQPQNPQEEFTARCRLYDLQMRSVLETNEIETTPLHADPAYPNPTSMEETGHRTTATFHTGVSRSRKVPDALFEPVYGFQKFAPDKLAKSGELLWKKLQAFDESRARLPPRRPLTACKAHLDLEEKTKRKMIEGVNLFGTSLSDKRGQVPSASLSSSVASSSTLKDHDIVHTRTNSRRSSTATRPHNTNLPPVKTPKLIRQISLGQRGFGIAAPTVATAELKTENVNAMQTSNQVPTPRMAPMRSNPRPTTPRSLTGLGTLQPFEQVKSDLSDQMHDLARNTPSRPMPIKSLSANTGPMSTLRANSLMAVPRAKSARPDDRDIKYSSALRTEDEQKLYNSKLLAGAMPELPSTLSPTATMSPWLVVLNPSNPDVNKIDDSLLFSRWQHVFPRPSDMRVMKWKSLSCPAAVPLTTEYFPTKTQFDTEYQRQPYNIAQNVDDDLPDAPKSREEFLRELVSARFSHGFQVVIGPSVAKAFGQKIVRIAELFTRNSRVEDGTSIFMSVGNTIHQLSCVNGTEIEVNIYVRKPTASLPQAEQIPLFYKPAIRTLHDKGYEPLEIDIVSPKPERNWNYIDSYLAGHTDEMTEYLRFWRARFVLIPMYSRNNSVSKMPNCDDEEEIRLEGIKKLAQLWQRHRIMSSSERHFQSSGTKHRDPYPLDIVYRTEDPSLVVAAELEALPLFEGFETTFRKRQLVSSKERFSKSNFNVAALAEAIQQPVEMGGIKMQTRRWHLHLHYNCFIGSEMTTWLLDNFEDLESREEAVELGNSLMVQQDNKSKEKEVGKEAKKDRGGIFVHVERRHPFRDGQYFYQIAGEFAKPNTQGWFNSRKSQMSVPATPLSEATSRDSPRLGPTNIPRPTSIYDGNSPISGSTTPTLGTTSGRRPQVVLSKVMKYDVDHRKRSYRPERINLHYDRLHNPDNCFHIRLDWVNVTAKLIEDAIKSWASIATQHGLRLVEVPIAEACTITDVNPFRRPYRVKLSVPPPAQRPITYYEPNSFSPQAPPCRHFYQKALLREFDYVLDVEAASNFPSNVDVSYSWGKPDFRYSQYIHKSGMILAEITDEGDFLLLANRLYSNRTAASAQHQQQQAQGRTSDPTAGGGGDRDRVPSASTRLMSGAGGGGGGPHAPYGLPEPTPIASPMFRPVLFASSSAKAPTSVPTRGGAPPQLQQQQTQSLSAAGAGEHSTGTGSNVMMSPAMGPAGVPPLPQQSAGTGPGPGPGGFTDGIQGFLKDTLEAFCSDPAKVSEFYRETQENGAGANHISYPGNHHVGGGGGGGFRRGTPASASTGPVPVQVPDSGIPVLGLPPGVLAHTSAAAGAGTGAVTSAGDSGAGVSAGGAGAGQGAAASPRVPGSALQQAMSFRRGSVPHLG